MYTLWKLSISKCPNRLIRYKFYCKYLISSSKTINFTTLHSSLIVILFSVYFTVYLKRGKQSFIKKTWSCNGCETTKIVISSTEATKK